MGAGSHNFEPSDIGTFFILRVNTPTLTDEMRRSLSEIKPIGIHFGNDAFLKNASYKEWLKQFSDLRDEIKDSVGREKLIWALDHEGGRVNRTPKPISALPYPLNWKEKSKEIGTLVGEELKSLGINLLFGPCLDIFTNSENRVIGPRAFGRTPSEVIEFGIPYIESVEKAGVITVPKHFPGHGDTIEDSHFELPKMSSTLESLSNRELLPFKESIKNGAHAFMLAHILFPEVNSTLPSSLSREMAHSLLREILGFKGVTITDDLDMKAIADNFKLELIATQIYKAKLDLLIFNHHFDRAKELHEILDRESKANLPYLEERARRISILFDALHFNEPNHLDEKTLEKHRKLSKELEEKHDIEIKDFTGD